MNSFSQLDPFAYTLDLVPVSALKPSEQINLERAEALMHQIKDMGRWVRPLLIERDSKLVMDGHHRLFSAQKLGLVYVPAVQLSYDDPRLSVTRWADSSPMDYRDITQAALTDTLLAYKTTRHVLRADLPLCDITLNSLRTGVEP